MIQVINQNNKPCMSIFDNATLDTLDAAIKTVDPSVAIDTVNYDTGIISISITYNKGTKDQWTNHGSMWPPTPWQQHSTMSTPGSTTAASNQPSGTSRHREAPVTHYPKDTPCTPIPSSPIST